MPKGAVLKKPVDYYAHLPGIYRKAQYSVCLTSMQLPKGLNQRHFDIWFAGGFCVTDAAGGLGLFPKELTEHITFTSVQNIAGTVSFLSKTHTYESRFKKPGRKSFYQSTPMCTEWELFFLLRHGLKNWCFTWRALHVGQDYCGVYLL